MDLGVAAGCGCCWVVCLMLLLLRVGCPVLRVVCSILRSVWELSVGGPSLLGAWVMTVVVKFPLGRMWTWS